MNTTEASIRQVARDLFAENRVDLVIGYEKGSLAVGSRPCFIRSADEVDRLVWDCFCTNNLAVYLPRFFERMDHKPNETRTPPRIGIVAKGCDARSALGLLKENQVPREHLTVIGVPCTGMVDLAKVRAAFGGNRLSGCRECPDGTLEVTTDSALQTQLRKDEALMEACAECPCPTLENADVSIDGEPGVASDRRYTRVTEMEGRSTAERWRHFEKELSRCIRCYACRQVCPNCYCKVCFAAQTKPSWIGAGDEVSDLMLYHLIRAYHQAGRCVGCDACVRACPVGIDLRLLNQKLGKDVEEMFGYVPGLSTEEPLPLCTFAVKDSQSFMTEP